MVEKDKDNRQSWGLPKTEKTHTIFPLQGKQEVPLKTLNKMMVGTSTDKRYATPYILAKEFLAMQWKLKKQLGDEGFKDIQKQVRKHQVGSLEEVVKQILRGKK